MNSNERCIAHLAAGGLLLTPDLRQARILRRLHDRAQANAGRKVWPSAQVLPLDTWLVQQWQRESADRQDLPAILPAIALRWLWCQQADRDAPGLLDPSDLGNRARQSWLRLRAHGGDLAALQQWPLTRDQQAFVGWARSVEGELQARHACDAGGLARLLVERAALPAVGPPILLAGFSRMTPAAVALLGAMSAAGHSIEQHSPPPGGGACFRHQAFDPASERDAMLAWLRERLALAPGGLHALIVPDLDASRGALERAFAAALQPELELPGSGREQRLYDLAGGHPLSVQPVVDAGLAAIACAAGAVDWTAASRLLLSAHVGGEDSERGARLAADLALRDTRSPLQVRAQRLADYASRAGAPGFSLAIRSAIAALDGPKRRSAGAWAEAFGASLAAWGWPVEAGLGSREYEAARRFRELLDEFASLSAVATSLDVDEAHAELRRLAAAPFQPESGEPAVFVLDAYDDPGVHFDSLWVAGLTASTWPRPITVDPLLPIEIQRKLGMPGVTPESRVAEAQGVIGRWRAAADTLVLSWPQFENDTEGDGTALLPADAPPLAPSPPAPTRERLAFANARLEAVPEEPPSAFPAQPAKGGARVLELQAQCPFRAFAELRLGAAPFEEPEAGFDRRLRGIVLHRAMQDLWSSLGSQASLAALDHPTRVARIETAVDDAIARVTPVGTGLATIALEREWQVRAVGRLLELDLLRPPFEVVETERALTLTIAGLDLRLRVDRVDRVGGELIVIDYKTGKAKAAAWRGARMDAPQLPLYAVLHPDHPTGIAFAGVGAASAQYLGVGRAGSAIDGVVPATAFALTEDRQKGFEWHEVIAHWQAWLVRLAGDFAAGQAEVNPKLAAKTCRYCHLSALCRVEPASPDDEDHEVNDGE